MTEIKEITNEEIYEIIEEGKPKGLFWCKDEDNFIACDNSSGDAWIEEFFDFDECIEWLQNN